MLQRCSLNGNILMQEDSLYFWMFYLERLNDMLQYNDYSCVPLAARLDYVDEPLRLKLSVNFTVRNRVMPSDTPLAELVGLGLSVPLWNKFHRPGICK